VEEHGTRISSIQIVTSVTLCVVNVFWCATIRADVSKEADVESAIAEAVAEFGRIDYAA
jgi:NAD(P)-dependent dehydrogenase (short-subunit alcohol dehydrogenase family)